jgi:hypothetical protein
MKFLLYFISICCLAGCDGAQSSTASQRVDPDHPSHGAMTNNDEEPNTELSEIVYPSIPSHASVVDGFVVDGWKLIATEYGDLNNDGIADVAALMRMTDPANVRTDTHSPYYEIDDTNPYLLAIGFAQHNGYILAATHHALFPREVAPMHGEGPPDQNSFDIKNGVLTLILEHLRGSEEVRFRWEGDAFALIGYDCAGVAGGNYVSLSANYLTRNARYERGTIDGDGLSASTVEIRPDERPTLEQIGTEFDWSGTDINGVRLQC